MNHGCSSANESYHSKCYNNGWVSKSNPANEQKLSIESGYALGSLSTSLEVSDFVQLVFDPVIWKIGDTSINSLQKRKDSQKASTNNVEINITQITCLSFH